MRITRLVVVLAALGGATACVPALRGARARPAHLAGLWVDVDRTTPGDTAFWRLAPDGAFRPFRVTADAPLAAAESRAPAHGYWHVRGADAAARTLCVHGRRVAAHCVGFTLDTLADGARRLRLAEHRGAFAVRARTLVERRGDVAAAQATP